MIQKFDFICNWNRLRLHLGVTKEFCQFAIIDFYGLGTLPLPQKNSTRKIKTHIFHFFAKRPKNILHNFVGSFFCDRHHMAQFVKRTNECFSYYHKKKQSQAVENKTKQPTTGYAMSLYSDEIVSQPLVHLSSSGRKCQGCLWRSVMLCKFYKTPWQHSHRSQQKVCC